ncbi:MAG: glycoside hydrolase family 3 protein [Simkaniaceae bacterium]|nr:glycoside hydrolase family 3 protein [Simkaniaceae bacterium]
MNLAPVVDINSNPQNPVIGIRSFGETPATVLAFGSHALKGYKKAHLIATLKHFPGHGDVSTDSHEDLPIVHKSKKALEELELLPFIKLASSADAIMTAHLLVPALDPKHCSTLSKKTLTYLKDTLGFQGVIVSDSLVMDGVLKTCGTVDEAAIRALKAGCDILILGGKLLTGEHAGFELSVADIKRVHQSLVEAVKQGRISEERLNQAVTKILTLKNRYLNTEPFNKSIDLEKHSALAQTIASLSLCVIEKTPIPPLHDKKVAVFAPQLLRETVNETSLLQLGKSADTLFFSGLSPSEAEIEQAKDCAEAADILLICSYNAWKNPSQAALIHTLLSMKKPVILVTTRDPLDALLFQEADLMIKTFSPTTPSIQAVCSYITSLSHS